MTEDGYRAKIKAWGLTPCRPSAARHTIHQTRDRQFIRVPDPQYLTEEERVGVLDLLQAINGLTGIN